MSGNSIYFLDTNILVYADDSADEEKKKISASLILEGFENSAVRISAQVLGEYFVTVTRKIARPLSFDEAARRVELFSLLPSIPIDSRLVASALSVARRYGLGYWDSLIVCAAAASGASVLYSEDLSDNQEYLGVRVKNPYK